MAWECLTGRSTSDSLSRSQRGTVLDAQQELKIHLLGEEQTERGEREVGGRKGEARWAGAAQGACRDGSRHQMAAHTRVGAWWGHPNSRDSGLRHATHPGAELPEPGKFRKGKESKTKHHRKVQSLVFMEFES